MLTLISLFVPPFLLLLFRERFEWKHKEPWKNLLKYIFTALVLNIVMIFIVRFLFGSSGNTIVKLTQYSNFALKYLVLSSVIAMVEPFAELYIKRKIMCRGGNETVEPIPIGKEIKNFWADIKFFAQKQCSAQKIWIRACISGYGARDWRIFKVVFLAAFLTHIFVFTNHLVNYDSVWSIYAKEDVVTSGRWFLKYAAGIGSYFRLPWVNGFLSILYISLSAVITARYLEINNVWLSILAGITLAVYPSVTLTFNFMYTADAYFLAMLMAVIASWLICMEQWVPRLLGGALVGFSMGIYQAYLSVTLVLLLLWLIKHALMKREAVIGHIFGMAVSLVFGAGFYVTALDYRLAGGQLDSYQGIAESTLLHSPDWYAKRFCNCFQDIIQAFASDAFENRYAEAAIVIVWSATAIYLLCYMICAVKKKQALPVLWGCLSMTMMPIAVYCLKFLSGGVWYYRLMLESIAFVWLLPVIIMDERIESAERKRKWKNMVHFVLIGCLLVNLWNYIIVDNISYFASSLANKKTYALTERILDRMEQTEGYEDVEYVWFCGSVEKIEYQDVRFQGKSVIDNGLIPYSGETYFGYIRNFLGITYEILDDEEKIEKIQKSIEFQNMPTWPSSECIKSIENVMVVKLGEEENH